MQQQALAVGGQGQGGALELGHRRVRQGVEAGWPDTVNRTRAATPPARAGRRRPRHPPRGESRSNQGTVVSPAGAGIRADGHGPQPTYSLPLPRREPSAVGRIRFHSPLRAAPEWARQAPSPDSRLNPCHHPDTAGIPSACARWTCWPQGSSPGSDPRCPQRPDPANAFSVPPPPGPGCRPAAGRAAGARSPHGHHRVLEADRQGVVAVGRQ